MESKEPVIAECSEFASRVRLYQESLSSSEQRIATFLLDNEKLCQELTIYQMAEQIGVSVATITRFCQTLGYKGLADMKFHLQQGAVDLVNKDMNIHQNDSVNTIKQKALQFTLSSIADCIMNTDSRSLSQAIDAIGQAHQVLFCAMGSATGIAQTGSGLFLSAGIPALYVADTLLQLRTVATLGANDTVVAINYDGYAKDTSDALMLAQEKGATTILISSCRNTLLERYASITLYTPARSAGNAMSITATTMCQLALIQSLMVGVVARYYKELSVASKAQLQLSDMKRYDTHQTSLHIGRVKQ